MRGHGGEMNDGVERRHARAGLQITKTAIRRHHVEHLPRVGDVRDQVVDARMIQRPEIDIDDMMSSVDEVGNDVTPGLARPAGEKNPFTHLSVS